MMLVFDGIRQWNKRATPDVADAPIRAELGIALGAFSVLLGLALLVIR